MGITAAVNKGLKTKNLADALFEVEDLSSAKEATAFFSVLPTLPVADEGTPPLAGIARLLRDSVDAERAAPVFAEHFDKLHDYYDRCLAELETDDDVSAVMDMLETYAAFSSAGGLERVLAASRDPRLVKPENRNLWIVLVRSYTQPGHPLAEQLAEGAARQTPSGSAALAMLETFNTMVAEERLERHPFASKGGLKQLRAWIVETDPAMAQVSFEATCALAAVDDDERDKLVKLAQESPLPRTRCKALSYALLGGDRSALKALARECLDVHASAAAREHLVALEHEDAIPAEAREADFEARALLSRELQESSQLGRVPDQLELFDARELDWPAAKETRRVWLFSWALGERSGIACVGTIPMIISDEETANLSAEDAYALYCCFDLAYHDDRRAPRTHSVKAGRKLLGW